MSRIFTGVTFRRVEAISLASRFRLLRLLGNQISAQAGPAAASLAGFSNVLEIVLDVCILALRVVNFIQEFPSWRARAKEEERRHAYLDRGDGGSSNLSAHGGTGNGYANELCV
jgi:hypothetical protein